jgi:hypothetical protein
VYDPECVRLARGSFLWCPSMNALVLSLSNIVICTVGAALYLAVKEFEPNRRLASAQRIAIVVVGAGAIFSHLMR